MTVFLSGLNTEETIKQSANFPCPMYLVWQKGR